MREILVETEGVDLNIEQISKDEVKITVKGEKGEVSKNIKAKDIEVNVENGKVKVKTKDKAMINTTLSHIKNMIRGVREGYTKKMVVRYSHFPMNLEVKGNKLIIKNFIGEREAREARIVGKTTVKVKGQDLVIEGVSKEDVGQTAANIRQATKIKKKDLRVFQDGIYLVE